MDDMRTKEILELRQQIEVLKKENELLRQNQIKTSEKPKKSRQTVNNYTIQIFIVFKANELTTSSFVELLENNIVYN